MGGINSASEFPSFPEMGSIGGFGNFGAQTAQQPAQKPSKPKTVAVKAAPSQPTQPMFGDFGGFGGGNQFPSIGGIGGQQTTPVGTVPQEKSPVELMQEGYAAAKAKLVEIQAKRAAAQKNVVYWQTNAEKIAAKVKGAIEAAKEKVEGPPVIPPLGLQQVSFQKPVRMYYRKEE